MKYNLRWLALSYLKISLFQESLVWGSNMFGISQSQSYNKRKAEIPEFHLFFWEDPSEIRSHMQYVIPKTREVVILSESAYLALKFWSQTWQGHARVNFEELLEAECSPAGKQGASGCYTFRGCPHLSKFHLQGPQQVLTVKNQGRAPHGQMGWDGGWGEVIFAKYDHMFSINKVCALWEKTLFY